MVDLEKIDFLPRYHLHSLEVKVSECLSDPWRVDQHLMIPEVEKADSLEALGVAQFFMGDYAAARDNLSLSLSFKASLARRSRHRLVYATLLLGMSRFRLGDLQQADDDLNGAARLALEGTSSSSSSPTHGGDGGSGPQQQVLGELAACALSNRAIVLMKRDLLPLAILEARKAVDVSMEYHVKHSPQHLQYVRILFLLYMKSQELSKAEILLEENEFPPQEGRMLSAGLFLLRGDWLTAERLLSELYDDLNHSQHSQQNRNLLPGGEEHDPNDPSHSHSYSHGQGQRLMGGEVSSSHRGSGGLIGGEEEMMSASIKVGEKSMAEEDNEAAFKPSFFHSLEPLIDDLPANTTSATSRSALGLEALLQRAELLINLRMISQFTTDNGGGSGGGGGGGGGGSESSVHADSDLIHLSNSLSVTKEDKTASAGGGGGGVPLPSPHQLFQDALAFLRKIAGTLYTMRSQSQTRSNRTLEEENLLLYYDGDNNMLEAGGAGRERRKPDYLPYDYYMYCIAMWSTLLLAKAEEQTVHAAYHRGLRIQCGEVVIEEVDPEVKATLNTIETSYKTALGILEACRTQTLALEESSKLFSELSTTAPPPPAAASVAMEPSTSSTTTTTPSIMIKEDDGEGEREEDIESIVSEHVQDLTRTPQDCPDTMIMKDALQSFSLYRSLHPNNSEARQGQGGEVQDQVSYEASVLLKQQGVEFNPRTGQLISRAGNIANNPTTTTATPSNANATNSRKSTLEKASPSRSTRSTMRASPSSMKVNTATPTNVSNSNNGNGNGNNNSLSNDFYVANQVDRLSCRAEMLPLLDRFGRDEVAAWLTWALANCGGVSLGYLGTTFQQPTTTTTASPSPTTAITTTTTSSEVKSQAFLIELRNRLLEVDRRLSYNYEEEGSYHHGELEFRVLVLLLLVKVTTQLLLKGDVLPLINHLQKASDLLYHQKPCLDSIFYVALAHKFKIEYEEWLMTPYLSTEERAQLLMTTFLPLVKVYFHRAQATKNVHLRQDGYKKRINTYTALNKCWTKIMNSASNSLASGGGAGHQTELTVEEELATLDEKVIEQYERNDLRWLLRHSKKRAAHFFQEMKAMMQSL